MTGLNDHFMQTMLNHQIVLDAQLDVGIRKGQFIICSSFSIETFHAKARHFEPHPQYSPIFHSR